MDGGHGGDANVVFAVAGVDAGPPVLRQAALGDIELRQDLDARDGGAAEIRRQDSCVLQNAVDPAADDDAPAGRLDVEIGGARRRGLPEQPVDEVDDRRVERQILDLLLIFAVSAGAVGLRRRAALAFAPDQPLDPRHDLAFGGDAEIQLPLAGDAERIERRLIGRIANRDGHQMRPGA